MPRHNNARKKDLYVIGASGHGKVVADIAATTGLFRVRGFLDDDPNKTGLRIGEWPVLGTTRQLASYLKDRETQIIVAIGSNRTRGVQANDALRQGAALATLVHPKAVIASDVQLGEGTVVMAGAVINSGTRVGRNVIINTGATVDHDCVLEDNVHISPGANLAGGVQVGTETHIGIGAAIIQNIRIGAQCVVGAGAVVIRDVSPAVIIVGNPARPIKEATDDRPVDHKIYAT